MSPESPPRHETAEVVDEPEAEPTPVIDAIATAMAIVWSLGICVIALAVVGTLAIALVWVAAWVESKLGLPVMPMVVSFFGIVLGLGVWWGPRRATQGETLDEEMRSYLFRRLLWDYSREPGQRRKRRRAPRSSRTRRTASRARTTSRGQ